MRTDHKTLQALVDDDRLKENERTAFEDMLSKLQSGERKVLSKAQREWADKRYLGLELDAEEAAKNLISNGIVNLSKSSIAPLAFELMPRPLKPPGRK